MSGKKLRSNKTQIRVLIDYMSTNPHAATGEFTGPMGNRRAEAQWLKIKDLLKNYGPDRTVEQWKQTWKDLKKNARSENALNAQASTSTGNHVFVPDVSTNTKKILDTIGHESSIGIGPEESAIGPIVIELADPLELPDAFPPPHVALPSVAPLSPPVALPTSPALPLSSIETDKENIPTTSRTSTSMPRKPARTAETLIRLQEDNNGILQNIALLLAERNELLRQQNKIMKEANDIAKRNSQSRRSSF